MYLLPNSAQGGAHNSPSLAVMAAACIEGFVADGGGMQACGRVPPDPNDRNLSKRQWELRMQAWRAAVKQFIR